jgi:phosphoglucomutase
MLNELIFNQYREWKRRISKEETEDKDLCDEIVKMSGDDNLIEDAFYRNLEFGTGGLRGLIGVGTNRMNIYTVAQASQGLANYIKSNSEKGEHKIAVAYDSRHKSELFAKIASQVFAANNINVKIYPVLMPTPCLSYAVRTLNCDAGIVITASHNPSTYNGYKVYGPDGGQITTETAAEILGEIEKIDIFEGVNKISFDAGINSGRISFIEQEVIETFNDNVKLQSMLFGDIINKDIPIVYSPLNGAGLKPVLKVLNSSGYRQISVVKEQENPDGDFTTCPYPNPETRAAMKLGIKYALEKKAELLLATDPDCDRVGIAVKDAKGKMVCLTGNEVGVLLFDYICSQRTKHNTMPKNAVMIKTIVTTDMVEQIAKKYGVKTINVLTGFKFIGEKITELENEGKVESFIFGFEESYGYLSGSYVRDKDAVNGVFLICEMFAYYRTRGISLLEKLNQLYEEYGYSLNTLYSYEFEGANGNEKMKKIMLKFRKNFSTLGGKRVIKVLDYSKCIEGLPKSNVIKFLLEDSSSVTVRPSGTEPKLKVYVSVSADMKKEALSTEKLVIKDIEKYLSC